MKYIEAPKYDTIIHPMIFLGGGISNCKDWQSKMCGDLQHLNVSIVNPRRAQYSDDKKIAREQIKWEFHYLSVSDIVVMYFAEETLCPITLFEFGSIMNRNLKRLETSQKICVYCEPNYKRSFDVKFQTKLLMDWSDESFVTISNSYSGLIKNVSRLAKQIGRNKKYYFA
jgi:hypothetical protein